MSDELAAMLVQQLRNELDHAHFNDHFLSADSQGVAPGERVPAIRASSVEAAIAGAFVRLGLPVPEWITDEPERTYFGGFAGVPPWSSDTYRDEPHIERGRE